MSIETVNCPSCGRVVLLEGLDYNVDVVDKTCKCGCALSIRIKLNPTFEVSTSVLKTCLECGDELSHYVAPDEESRVMKYRDIPTSDYCLCGACTAKIKLSEVTSPGFNFVMRKKAK